MVPSSDCIGARIVTEIRQTLKISTEYLLFIHCFPLCPHSFSHGSIAKALVVLIQWLDMVGVSVNGQVLDRLG